MSVGRGCVHRLSHLERWERWAPEAWMLPPPPTPSLPLGPWLSLPTFAEAAKMSQMIAVTSLLAPLPPLPACSLRPSPYLAPLCAHSGGSPCIPPRGPWALSSSPCLPPLQPHQPHFPGTLPPGTSAPGTFFSKTDPWLAPDSCLKCRLSVRPSWPPFTLNGPL